MGKKLLNETACGFALDAAIETGRAPEEMGTALGRLALAADEISSAVESVQGRSWHELHSIDAILVAEENAVHCAEAADVPVEVYGTGAAYSALVDELPENYKQQHDIAAGNEDDDPEPDYSFGIDDAWVRTEKEYEKEIEASVSLHIFHLSHQPGFKSSAEQDRNTYLKIELGPWAWVLYELEKKRH